MSVWNDIRKKSLGKERRIEKDVNDAAYATKELVDSMTRTTMYAGLINRQSPPSSIQSGKIYMVTEDCTHNDTIYHKGTLVLFNGKNYVTIGYEADDATSSVQTNIYEKDINYSGE